MTSSKDNTVLEAKMKSVSKFSNNISHLVPDVLRQGQFLRVSENFHNHITITNITNIDTKKKLSLIEQCYTNFYVKKSHICIDVSFFNYNQSMVLHCKMNVWQNN